MYKTSLHSFYLPIALGMRLAGITDKGKYDMTREICMDLGHYFQAQDDYIDCFGDPEVTGKVATDIEDNKCTWLVVEFLKTASDAEKIAIEKNYGRVDPAAILTVRNMYRDARIPARYKAFEAGMSANLEKKITTIRSMPNGAFKFFLRRIVNRKK